MDDGRHLRAGSGAAASAPPSTRSATRRSDAATARRAGAAGLVSGQLELSEDGKAMKFYEVTDFDVQLTAAALAEAAKTLTTPDPEKGPERKEES